MKKQEHGFVAEVRGKYGQSQVHCRCGEKSPKTTSSKAHRWFQDHAGHDWSAWDSVFAGF